MPERASAETQQHKEIQIVSPKNNPAFEARLILGGEALNPEKLDLPKISEADLQKPLDLTPIVKASNNERIIWWQQQVEKDYPAQKKRWVNEMVAAFAKKKVTSQTADWQRWGAFFQKIGVSNFDNFKPEDAEAFYNEYFGTDGRNSEIGKFNSRIIQGYTDPASGSVDLAAITRDIDAAEWVGGTFGRFSSLVTAQTLLTQAKMKDPGYSTLLAEQMKEEKDILVNGKPTKKQRINRLNEEEKFLLTIIALEGNVFRPEEEKKTKESSPIRAIPTAPTPPTPKPSPLPPTPVPQDTTPVGSVNVSEDINDGVTGQKQTVDQENISDPIKAYLERSVDPQIPVFAISKNGEHYKIDRERTEQLNLILTEHGPQLSPTFVTHLITADGQVLFGREKISMEAFLKETPRVDVRQDLFEAEQLEKFKTSYGDDRNIRLLSARDYAVTILDVPDSKEQDAVAYDIGFRKLHTVINIVVADGVTNSVLPEAAARLAVKTSTKHLIGFVPSLDILKGANTAIQNPLIKALAESRIRSYREQAATEQNPIKRYQIEGFANRQQELLERGATAATMLAAAQYDREENKLRFAMKGDTSILFFHRDGTYDIVVGPESSMYYDEQNPELSDKGINIGEKDLIPGDVVFIQSDGLEKTDGIFDAVGKFINDHQVIQRLDKEIGAFLKEQIKLSTPDDDITTVIISHEPAQHITPPVSVITEPPVQTQTEQITLPPQPDKQHIEKITLQSNEMREELIERLNNTSATSAEVLATPNQLVGYLRTLEFTLGAHMKECEAKIKTEKNKKTLAVNGKVGFSWLPGINVGFDTKLTANPEGELEVIDHKVKYPKLIPTPGLNREEIENTIANLHQFLIKNFNSWLPQGWSVKGFDIIDENTLKLTTSR